MRAQNAVFLPYCISCNKGWAGHIARVGNGGNAYKFVVQMPESWRQLVNLGLGRSIL